MSRLLSLGLALAATAGLWACSGDDPPASLPMDAGITQDGSITGEDAGSSSDDAAVSSDASTAPDSGSQIDDECDPVTDPSGCDPDQKCVIENPTPNGGALCVQSSPNDVALGEECTGQDCEAGLGCVRTSTVPTCIQLCNIATGEGCQQLTPEHECLTRITGTNWGGCLPLPPTCPPTPPAEPNPCDPGQACQPFTRRTGVADFRCRPEGSGVDGDPCGPQAGGAGCQAGLVCISTPSGDAGCEIVCTMNSDCPDMRQCNGSVSSTNPPFMFCGDP